MKKNGKSGLFITAFNVNRTPEVVKYNTHDEAEAELQIMKKVAEEDSLGLSFDIVDIDTMSDD